SDRDRAPTPRAARRRHRRILASGSRGPQVYELQALLTAAGHTTRLDGRFGADTRAAVIAFQRAHGLATDGIAGRETWAVLDLLRFGPRSL
ncbi:MAG TPA: peptidoglycan-binding domain-containing protein, partial [Kofleriaceae bacterium]|nr:peptidoglycan-binding domain-containing protein [Kofleriaceae bacterium]